MFEAYEEPVELWPGVTRQVQLHGERMLLMKVWLDEGSVVEDHAHPHEQVTYLLAGRLVFYRDGERTVMEAGETLLTPGGVVHRVEALAPSVAIDVFSPPREDYLRPGDRSGDGG